MDDVIYECGCAMSRVGQSFVQGLVVCPAHTEPVAPFDRAPAPHRHRLTAVIELETHDAESHQRFADWLDRLLMHDNRATSFTIAIEERQPLEPKVAA